MSRRLFENEMAAKRANARTHDFSLKQLQVADLQNIMGAEGGLP
jgi:hypothetical protein